MFGPANAGYDQVKVINSLRVHLHQRTRKEIRLFLIVALDDDPISWGDERLERFHDSLLAQNGTTEPVGDESHSSRFFITASGPVFLHGCCLNVHSTFDPSTAIGCG